MQKLLEALKEDFLVTVENNGDYQQATSLGDDIIIFDNELLGEPLTIDTLNDEDDGIIEASWLAYLTFENGKIISWVIRSTTTFDFERTKYLNELLAPYFAKEL